MWVQIALNATAVLDVGRATTSGLPAGLVAATADPTGMSASVASGLLPVAEDGVPEPVPPALSLLASLLSDFPQPARASAPAAPVPTSTPRRLTTTSVTLNLS